MSYQEQAVVFACEGEPLTGIVSLPVTPPSQESPTSKTGVVIIVGGPQYRAGSHRQFVHLARALAAAGIPAIRFDYRGMGDSAGALHTFENVDADIAAAIDALQAAAPGVRNVALWGLCDGASAALLYCQSTQDRRVRGLCLLNPWVRSAASLAKTHVKHYYLHRLRQKEFWLNLLSGKVAASAVKGLADNIKVAFSGPSAKAAKGDPLPYQARMAKAWMQFKGPMLLILSGDDYTAKEFIEYANTEAPWVRALAQPGLDQFMISGVDHTFSSATARAVVENKTISWIKSCRESFDGDKL